MPAYFIRRLTRDDEPSLWTMLYYALHVPAGCSPFPKEIVNQPEISRYVLGWGKEGDQGFAAVDEIGSTLIGAAWFRLFPAGLRGYGYLGDAIPELSIALLPEYRNQGIGTDLLTHLIEAARSQYSALSLSVSPDNPAARLYRRLGFEDIEVTETSIVMKKEFDLRSS